MAAPNITTDIRVGSCGRTQAQCSSLMHFVNVDRVRVYQRVDDMTGVLFSFFAQLLPINWWYISLLTITIHWMHLTKRFVLNAQPVRFGDDNRVPQVGFFPLSTSLQLFNFYCSGETKCVYKWTCTVMILLRFNRLALRIGTCALCQCNHSNISFYFFPLMPLSVIISRLLLAAFSSVHCPLSVNVCE